MRILGLLTAGLGLFVLAACKPAEPAGLSLKQDRDRIVLHWNGPIEAPMRDRFVEAFETFEDDPRQLVISLNSPGGSVDHGHQVIREIRKVSRTRAVDTIVETGKSCASMCVPIYLVGAERTATPGAKFMFHEVSFKLKPDMDPRLRQQLSNPSIRRIAVNHFTNEFFDDDLGPRSVDATWLKEMRSKIRGRDVWLTGKQLMDQRSGVVDKLL